jgi:DNA polymerase
MSGIKRDLLAYAEFLRQSGYLYVEGGAQAVSAAPTPAAPRATAPLDVRPPRKETPPVTPPRSAPDPLMPVSAAARTLSPLTPEERASSEREARARVAACKACALAGTRTQTVYGTGSLDAKIVFVGEAPGAEEDKTGVPFVGRAGQLLTKMIESIGFTRDEVYICNTIKCRPPDNRDPTPEEKATCRPFLEEQLRILRPQILVGLGAHAAGYLTGLQTSLGSMRRKWHEFEGVPTMVTYHPAFLLRSPGMKKQAWEDLQMLAGRYNELNPEDARELWKKTVE